MRKLLALALAWPLLTGCAAASTVADEPSGYTPPSSVAPADPRDTDANRTACSAARREVSKRAAVFADLVKGTATAADGEKAAKELQGKMRDISSFAESDIRVQTVALTDAYGRLRVGLATDDADTLTRGAQEQSAALAELDKLCESIGE